MRVVLQRVTEAAVQVEDEVVAQIGPGLLILVGIEQSDTHSEIEAAADKITSLRIFADEAGQMNRSIRDVGGGALVVSQFTLLADVRRGRRPSFDAAGTPDHAREMVEMFAAAFRTRGVPTGEGRFGERMRVSLTNDGPVTILMAIADGRVS